MLKLTNEQDSFHAFQRIYETNASSLIRFARRYTSPEIAEDIVQDIFLELWESKKSFDEDTARFYLFTAIKNRCLNLLRQEQVKDNYISSIQTENHLLSLQHYDPADELLSKEEDLHEIYKQIEFLPEKCRQIFKLAYLEDKKSPEIADILKLSVRTVEHHLYLGLKTLRTKLLQKKK